MVDQREDAYCTLLMSDNYLPGAMVLAHSLRDAGTTKKLAVLITKDSLDDSTIRELEKLYDYIIPVDRVVNHSPANLFLMNRPELHSAFTKINLWKLKQFRKIVYIDADVVALRAPDELFNIEESFAAAPDIGWPDCFNSGVMVLNPNIGDYYGTLALAQRGISFDGADQGLLNMHFTRFHRLSFAYNCTPSGHYQYVPAYRHFQSSISMVHYIGSDKPWLQGRDAARSGSVYDELLGRWWSVYDRHYRDNTAQVSGGLSRPASRAVQQYVKGGAIDQENVLPAVEPSMHDASKEATERTVQEGQSTLTSAQKRVEFAAPLVDWDPSRTAPPSNSGPEAANFPQHTYEMSHDSHLWKAPRPPQPPRDFVYHIPQPTPAGERPKPIFPWESTAPKPTRVFNDDFETSPPPSSASAPSITDDDAQEEDESALTTPTAKPLSPEPWKTFSSLNAWDDVPEIDQYMSKLASKTRTGNVEVLQGGASDADVRSPGARRASTKVTDFPTEVERPSLPVTPAPVQRARFWGAERNKDGDLPAAEGVPKQEDWDPTARLEELIRHQPDVLPTDQDLPTSPRREIPDRAQPESAMPMPTSPPSASQRGPASKEVPPQRIAAMNTFAPATVDTVDARMAFVGESVAPGQAMSPTPPASGSQIPVLPK